MNSKISRINAILRGEDFGSTSKKLGRSKEKGVSTKTIGSDTNTLDSVGVLQHLCATLRPQLDAAVPEGGLVIKALEDHGDTVMQIRKLQHAFQCNDKMLKVIVAIHEYNRLSDSNKNLVKRRGTLRKISEIIHSALGMRDHRRQKLVKLGIASGRHFGICVDEQPPAPALVQAVTRFNPSMCLKVNAESLLWEEVPGYAHRVPCILTTIERGMHELDAFRIDHVFGLQVPRRKVQQMRENIEHGHETSVDHGGLLAALLKHWLRELKHPLLQLDGPKGLDGKCFLMDEVLQGTNATVEHIRAVVCRSDISAVQRTVFQYVLNLLSMTVESNPGKNTPDSLAMHLVEALCHKRKSSRPGKLARAFLEQCIRVQVENRRCHPEEFVPCGSMSPVMRKFLTKMLIRADDMHMHLGKVAELEQEISTNALIAAVEGADASAPNKRRWTRYVCECVCVYVRTCMGRVYVHVGCVCMYFCVSFIAPVCMCTCVYSRKRRTTNKKLTGIYNLERMASPFHIPAEHLRPFYNEWKVRLR